MKFPSKTSSIAAFRENDSLCISSTPLTFTIILITLIRFPSQDPHHRLQWLLRSFSRQHQDIQDPLMLSRLIHDPGGRHSGCGRWLGMPSYANE